ncbi:MAG: hypothetical protein HKN09_11740 [Saprospiraceae bacterium]|nr:hypothetical protein [Saprospiraceae bacterium]
MFSFNKQVLERSKIIPVIVEFSADGCGPCQWVENLMIDIHAENADRFEFVSIPITMHEEAAQLFDLRSNPTLIIFQQGEAIAKLAGALPKMAVLQWIDDHLK